MNKKTIELPTVDEIKDWLCKDYSHLNPELQPYFLMGVNALYVHLGGDQIMTIKR